MSGPRRVSGTAEAGFSVWEIVVVAVVLGGVAAFLVPRVELFFAHGRQDEAKNNLELIGNLETAYLKEHRTYSRDLGALGFTPPPTGVYHYTVESAGPDSFTALAQATAVDAVRPGCGVLERWTIDQGGQVRAPVDCTAETAEPRRKH